MLVMLNHPKPFKGKVRLIFKFYFYNHSNSLNIDDHFYFLFMTFFLYVKGHI
jgi:hypothetical protein